MDGVESIDVEHGKIAVKFDETAIEEEKLTKIARDSIEKLGYRVEESESDFSEQSHELKKNCTGDGDDHRYRRLSWSRMAVDAQKGTAGRKDGVVNAAVTGRG